MRFANLIFVLLLTLLVPMSAFARPIMHTQSSTSVSASTKVLDQYKNRNYLIVQNTGSAGIYLKFGTAIASTEGILIPAGGNYELLAPPIDAVYLKAATGSVTYRLLEGGF